LLLKITGRWILVTHRHGRFYPDDPFTVEIIPELRPIGTFSTNPKPIPALGRFELAT
jgi:hypothetical protein